MERNIKCGERKEEKKWLVNNNALYEKALTCK